MNKTFLLIFALKKRFKLPGNLPPVSVFPKRIATLTRMQGGQRHVISWMDAPDDVYFKASPVNTLLRI